MGAKTALTLALSKPDLLANVVAVDNAPVDATLKSDFAGYVQGMRRVEDAGVKKQSEADEILKEYAPVWVTQFPCYLKASVTAGLSRPYTPSSPLPKAGLPTKMLTAHGCRNYQSANSSSPISPSRATPIPTNGASRCGHSP